MFPTKHSPPLSTAKQTQEGTSSHPWALHCPQWKSLHAGADSGSRLQHINQSVLRDPCSIFHFCQNCPSLQTAGHGPGTSSAPHPIAFRPKTCFRCTEQFWCVVRTKAAFVFPTSSFKYNAEYVFKPKYTQTDC